MLWNLYGFTITFLLLVLMMLMVEEHPHWKESKSTLFQQTILVMNMPFCQLGSLLITSKHKFSKIKTLCGTTLHNTTGGEWPWVIIINILDKAECMVCPIFIERIINDCWDAGQKLAVAAFIVANTDIISSTALRKKTNAINAYLISQNLHTDHHLLHFLPKQKHC